MARLLLIPACLVLLLAIPAQATSLSGWSQYGANGVVEARLVTDDPACPALILDGKSQPMQQRTPPSAAFPARICVAPIPAGSKSAQAGGIDLPVPVARPRHIVLIGDTGCRLKGLIVQACNDETLWPFHRVARQAAAEHPDLVIHVGDYLYRETPCLPLDDRCAGTPWGDNWPTWAADFFTPGQDLLRSAVWLAERGNHEDCHRAGIGWTTLLGRDPVTAPCAPHERPLMVDLDGVKLAVLDDNDASDVEVLPAVAAQLNKEIAAAIAAKADWLVTHHPFRGVVNPTVGANATLTAALQGIDEAPLTLMLAGHIHNFQIENYDGGAAPQLVVGEGGDKLDTDVPPVLTGLVSGGHTISSGLSLPGFGYVVIDRVGDSKDWTLTVHAADGAVLRNCSLTARKLACQG